MEPAMIDESRLKDLLKTAIVEVLEENRSLLSELITDALEDIALIQAIKEGEGSAEIDRAEVFDLLDDQK